MDAEQFINTLLDRCERNGRSADKAWKKYTDARDKAAFLEKTLLTSQEGNRRYLRDLDAADKKIAEWAEFAGKLEATINALDPKGIKRKGSVMPDRPTPFETEIPF